MHLIEEVADALDYAHRHNMVHRNIKLDKILLHEGHVVVADFGIGLSSAGSGLSMVRRSRSPCNCGAYSEVRDLEPSASGDSTRNQSGVVEPKSRWDLIRSQ